MECNLLPDTVVSPRRVLCAIGSMDAGGAERQLLNVLKQLDRARYVPLLYLIHRRGSLLSDLPGDVPVIAFEDRIRHPAFYLPGYIHHLQVRDFCSVIREQHIDLVYDRTWFMSLISAPACRKNRTPRLSVIDSHPANDLRLTGGKFQFVKKRLLRRAYADASRVITVSEALRKEVLDFYRLPDHQVLALVNGIDIDEIDQLATQAVEPFDRQLFHVVTAGRIQREKGYQHLLQAFEILIHRRGLSQLRLHILGDGPQRTELENLARSLKIDGYVRFHGFIANPYPYFRQADLYCLSSLHEGLPTVLLEALACRLPILATDCPTGPREILAGGKFGHLVSPADILALADAIAAAMVDSTSLKSAVEPGRRHVEQHYSLSRHIERLQSLMDDLGG